MGDVLMFSPRPVGIDLVIIKHIKKVSIAEKELCLISSKKRRKVSKIGRYPRSIISTYVGIADRMSSVLSLSQGDSTPITSKIDSVVDELMMTDVGNNKSHDQSGPKSALTSLEKVATEEDKENTTSSSNNNNKVEPSSTVVADEKGLNEPEDNDGGEEEDSKKSVVEEEVSDSTLEEEKEDEKLTEDAGQEDADDDEEGGEDGTTEVSNAEVPEETLDGSAEIVDKEEEPSVEQPEEKSFYEDQDKENDEEIVEVEERVKSSNNDEYQVESLKDESISEFRNADYSGAIDIKEDQDEENGEDVLLPGEEKEEEELALGSGLSPSRSTRFGKAFQSFGNRFLEKRNTLKDNKFVKSLNQFKIVAARTKEEVEVEAIQTQRWLAAGALVRAVNHVLYPLLSPTSLHR